MNFPMKKIVGLIATSIILLSGMVTANSAETISSNPFEIMEQKRPTSGARGLVFVENVEMGSSIGFIRYSHIPKFKPDGSIEASDYWDWTKCYSWADPDCKTKNGHSLNGKVFFGTCINGEELGCIENFSLLDSSGVNKKVTLVGKSFSGAVDVPEHRGLGIPRSSSPPVYRDDENNYFVVRAGLFVDISGTSQPTLKLDVDVTPVSRTLDSSLVAPQVVRIFEPRTGKHFVSVNPSPSQCISMDVGVCFKSITQATDQKYSVAIRVPRTISGWLRGRASEASFEVKLINEKSQLITMTAKPVRMPVAGGWINFSDLPNGFLDKIYPSGGYDPSPTSSYYLAADPSQGDRGLEEYEAWSPYLKERALTTVTNWSFGTNMSGPEESCLKVPGKISGFVASNASVYSSKPPEWDAAASTLSYKVAAPHYDENGIKNSGTYTLAMPLASIQCLYGESKLPPSATVSIAYGSEVTTVATVSLKSDAGWIFFSANGFHYSNPKIVVKFNKSLTTSASTSKAPQASASAKAIWCAKGTAKRKVTAAKPACPKGFKKIADPTTR
jgi:hypothetical protein